MSAEIRWSKVIRPEDTDWRHTGYQIGFNAIVDVPTPELADFEERLTNVPECRILSKMNQGPRVRFTVAMPDGIASVQFKLIL
jgi:hypothetical protein